MISGVENGAAKRFAAASDRRRAGGGAMTGTVLVAYGTGHDSTRGIAGAVAEVLRAAAIPVELTSMDAVRDLEHARAAVLGSVVYDGGWLPGAHDFLATHERSLAAIPTWLFASGPLDPVPPGRDRGPAGRPGRGDRADRATRRRAVHRIQPAAPHGVGAAPPFDGRPEEHRGPSRLGGNRAVGPQHSRHAPRGATARRGHVVGLRRRILSTVSQSSSSLHAPAARMVHRRSHGRLCTSRRTRPALR